MKDEIKEILSFKEDADYKKLSVDEITTLKKYITCLEKENTRLKAFEERINSEELLKHKGEYYLSIVDSQRLMR